MQLNGGFTLAIAAIVRKIAKNLSNYQNILTITCDNAYPTGGYPLPAAKMGLTTIDFVFPSSSSTGHSVHYDHANSKLKLFTTAGAEVANNTDLSAVTLRILAIGT
jgi:hypothetical protein